MHPLVFAKCSLAVSNGHFLWIWRARFLSNSLPFRPFSRDLFSLYPSLILYSLATAVTVPKRKGDGAVKGALRGRQPKNTKTDTYSEKDCKFVKQSEKKRHRSN